MSWLGKNKLWEWNRYNKSLLLYLPLSLLAIFLAFIAAVSIAAGVLQAIF